MRVLAVLGRGVVDPDTPVVRADDDGLTRGDGCFEGCRLVDGAVVKLDAHLARMARSCASLEIDFDPGPWRALVAEAVAAWTAEGEAAVKLLITRSGTGFVWIVPMPAERIALRRSGIAAITLNRGVASDAFTDAPWLLGGVKTLSYAINMAAGRVAERRGALDVIFVSADGFVLESPTSSVVWALGRTLSTTATGPTGILRGTTQELLFENAAAAGWRTEYVLGTVADLHAADAVWLISSVRGPVEVVELDGTTRAQRPGLHAEVLRLAGFSLPS